MGEVWGVSERGLDMEALYIFVLRWPLHVPVRIIWSKSITASTSSSQEDWISLLQNLKEIDSNDLVPDD
jgi:hypothetical protein